MITQRKVPFKPRAPHIDEWCNSREVMNIVAASNPNAPAEYKVHNLLAQIKSSKRSIRYMYNGRHIYLHKSDLIESLKERPIYAGSGQSPRPDALLSCIHHNYVDSAPDDGFTWMTPASVAQITGARLNRIYSFIRKHRIKCLMIENKIHVRLEEAKEALSIRPGYFIRKLGLNPKNYKPVKNNYYFGVAMWLYYAPDLIGK